MSTASIIVLVLVVLVLLGFFLAPAWNRRTLAADCKRLEGELAARTAQGASFTDIDPLQRQLTACREALAAAGVDVDVAGEASEDCLASRDRIRREWSDFLVTSYADIMKRDNKRGAIFRIGAEMVECFRRAGGLAGTNGPAMQKVLLDLQSALDDSTERIRQIETQAPGTDRYLGSTEESPAGKAAQERQHIETPLRDLYAELSAKMVADQRARDHARITRPEVLARSAARRAESAAFWAAEIARADAARAAGGMVT